MKHYIPIILRYLQDYGLLGREATVDINVSEEPAASIFAVDTPKQQIQHFQLLVPSNRKYTMQLSARITIGFYFI
jgi:hypothetical protein